MGKVVDLSEGTLDYHARRVEEALARGDLEDVRKSMPYLNAGVRANVSEKRRYAIENARLEKEANTDELTKLYNRRAYDRSIEDKVADKEGALLYFDVDKFKNFNDKYGHPAGDYVLRKIGRILKKNLRETDIPCRYGGEEFAVVLPGTDRSGAYAAAEHLRKAIEGEKWEYGGKDLGKVTVSIGVAGIDENDTVKSVLDRADKKLYEAKEGGRNRVLLED